MDDITRFFYELTPHTVLDAVEELGVRCTGKALALNSMENRVYELEIEVPDPDALQSRFGAYRIAKFYRPGRWSEAQILEEHEFLFDLDKADIPVVCPLKFPDGSTLKKLPGKEIWFTVFPKVGGRNLDELDSPRLESVGRLLARLHSVGASKELTHRPALTVQTYGEENLEVILKSEHFPKELEQQYSQLVTTICEMSQPLFDTFPSQRVHGDFHVGNVLWIDHSCFVVDLDDMTSAPASQDIWLIQPGRDEVALDQREILLSAYESMRNFDRSSLALVEPLRALRIIRFSAWIAQRWEDPCFSRVFTDFGSPKYWRDQVATLLEQLQIMQGSEFY